jgi:GT2 family glycosyltransferase
MKAKVALCIPTINRADLLNNALEKYVSNWDKVYIQDNGNQNIMIHPKVKVLKSASNLGVSGSWNNLAITCFNLGYTHVALCNDDVEWYKTQAEVEEYINNNPTDFYVGTGTWCNFILPKDTLVKVGLFDEQFFPAYFEDNDYCYRMRLLELQRINDEFFNPELFRNSQTIARDSSLNTNFDRNKELFKQKWGGYPQHETYKTPYGK